MKYIDYVNLHKERLLSFVISLKHMDCGEIYNKCGEIYHKQFNPWVQLGVSRQNNWVVRLRSKS